MVEYECGGLPTRVGEARPLHNPTLYAALIFANVLLLMAIYLGNVSMEGFFMCHGAALAALGLTAEAVREDERERLKRARVPAVTGGSQHTLLPAGPRGRELEDL